MNQTAAAANEMTRRIAEVSMEAERTGQRSAQVRNDTIAFNTMVGELKHSLTRVVRTSTTEVDRRHHERVAVDLGCRIELDGAAGVRARVVDISTGGAAVTGGPPTRPGARGTLEVDRISMKLPFVVRSTENAALHLTFDIDAAGVNRLSGMLEQLRTHRAA